MKKLFLAFVLLSFPFDSHCEHIGLCIMATGKYATYAERFVESCRKFFFTNHQVTYFIFTDQPLQPSKDVVRVEQQRLGWPFDTMMRFKVYYQHRELFHNIDYLYASDADMLFVDYVGDEILSTRIGTQHPGFVGKRGSYETNPQSTACISNKEGKTYFAGGFYGGEKNEFLNICKIASQNIEVDLQKNLIAVWHDESHLNRYFVDHPPTKVLSPAYCYPESWNIPYKKKLLALDKNHQDMRQK